MKLYGTPHTVAQSTRAASTPPLALVDRTKAPTARADTSDSFDKGWRVTIVRQPPASPTLVDFR